MEDNTFHEEQRFRQMWLWIVVCASTMTLSGLMMVGMFEQLVLHHPFGTKPMTDGAMMVFGPVAILFMLAMFSLFLYARLITEVRGDGVYIKFIPFHRRFHWYQFKDILTAEAVTYRPLMEYGGWGIRYGKNGKAYNVSGNRGVLITFTNGTTLMIGSDRAEEFAEAINTAR